MAFYVRKNLAHGPIRFGVPPRSRIEEIDRAGLSTGASGEFLRKRTKGFIFADVRAIGTPELPRDESIASMPFWSSVIDGTRRGWIYAAMMAFGLLLSLWGLAVLVRLGPQGWILIIIGLILLLTPPVITAQQRRQVREAEKHERAEREERERRHREALASYSAALELLRAEPTEEKYAAAARERDSLDLSYEVWAPLARRTVLHIGFQALARLAPRRSAEVSEIMSRAAASVGLSEVDEREVKLDLYRIVIWHLLADDRLGEVQEQMLAEIREGFKISDEDVPVAVKASDQFRRLRGHSPDNVPRHDCGIQLKFHEYCIHTTRARLLKRKREKVDGKRVVRHTPTEEGTLYVTNKRLILALGKQRDIPLPKIDDIEVDVDADIMSVKTALRFGSPDFRLDDPIYTGALIDIATMINERPRGFA